MLRVLGRWLGATLAAERDRWALWLPVAFGGGIGLYFALPAEPPLWLGPAATLALAAMFLGLRKPALPRLLLTAALAISAGLTAAELRTRAVAAPVLLERHGPVELRGVIERLEPDGKTTRVTLAPLAIEGLAPESLPRRVRVRMPGELPADARPGAVMTLRATLLPPPGPALPGGYDFAREAWYRGLGAVGYAFQPGQVETGAVAASGWQLWWSGLRQDWSRRLRAVLPGDVGAVADALVTGERGGLSPAMEQAYRDSGLAHLLSISGLHVGLLAGLIFVGLRSGLALVPAVALRWPIKKWAAGGALLAMPPYLWLVGASIPTQRACLMVGLVLLAVLLDRRALSLRLVAWAAVLVLALAPEALLTPSFQMSFGAVTALIAGYELWSRRSVERAERGWPWRILAYLGGVLLSSLIASTATAPFAAFHFDRLTLYGLAANLAAVPITGFWIMPLALATYLLMPLGLEAWALTPLGWGVEAVNWVATEVASWPGAALPVPGMPVWGLLLVAFGGLWLCLWSRPWRLAGIALLLAGAASPWLVRPPDILVSGDAKVVGLADPAGRLWLSSNRAGRFSSEEWLQRRGQTETTVWWRDEPGVAAWLSCDPLGCLYRRDGRIVALAFDGDALLEDCWGNDLLVALLPIRRACPAGTQARDRFDLWREGTLAVWVEARGIRILSVAAWRGDRPWSPRRTGETVALPDADED